MPQLPMGFLEHAQSTRHLMHAKHMADMQWWCTRLAGASLEPLLKTDFPRGGRANMGQNQGDIVKVCACLFGNHTRSNLSLPEPEAHCLLARLRIMG